MNELARERRLNLLHLLADVWAVVLAYYVTLHLRFHSEAGARFFGWANRVLSTAWEFPLAGSDHEAFYWIHAPRILLLFAATLCFLYAWLNLYEGTRFIRRRAADAASIVAANAVTLLLFFSYFYLSRNQFHPRSMFLTAIVLNTVFCIGLRATGSALLQALRRRGHDRCPVLVVGAGSEADFLHDYLGAIRPHGLEVVRRVVLDPDASPAARAQALEGALEESRAAMLVCADRSMDLATIMQALDLANCRGLVAKVWSDRLEVLPNQARAPADFFFGVPLIHFPPAGAHPAADALRRALGVLGCLALLVITAPLMALIAVAIKLSSPGPVFFVQERIGFNRQPFRMFKFRTMHTSAEERQAEMEEFNETGSAALFKMRRDPRVTPLGRVLRRLSLDELPQAFNVVRGDMQLVGPRPLPHRDYANYYEQWHYGRHGGLPGITGLWQVSGRSDIDFQSMCILDIYYLRNAGLLLDLKILLRTVAGVLFARGAY